MIKNLLVANRGEIACRIFQTCERLGIEKLAVYSDADAEAMHVRMADRAIRIGESPATASYLNHDNVLAAAAELGADAIHPGYGFLSESSDFARKVATAGITWIGPDASAMDAMSEKVAARRLMHEAGVPIVPGSEGQMAELDISIEEAARIGYPVMLKASAGGGGIGMTVVRNENELTSTFLAAKGKAERFFGDGAVYLEKFIESARHVEVQILGLNSGEIVVVGDRDCSVQRRHQKVLEEAPCPGLSAEERDSLHNAARLAAAKVNYRGAGTVEMILDLADRRLYFLEMNTRLQVEHPVTELVTGIDLVEAQIRIAQGEDLTGDWTGSHPPSGHALEFRVYAEDPVRYLPGPGTITVWDQPSGAGIRVDSGYAVGDVVTPYYDPLLAKLCVHADSRDEAISLLEKAAAEFRIEGPKQNLALVKPILADATFLAVQHDTAILEHLNKRPTHPNHTINQE